ncbi:MAG TPA: FTR1 family protein, partial [Candidatus Methylomirabilis sp.]|nr:FTR1 family protein [Candidatus Methylomirabilis sp.]
MSKVYLSVLRWLCLGAVAGSASLAAAAESAPPADLAQTLLHILDYVAVDYAGAVKDGAVTDKSEYDEQVGFVAEARAMLERLPPHPERPALAAQADRLVSLVAAKRPGEEVAALARQLGRAIIAAYAVPVAPRRPPDLQGATALYAAQCAACHGADGQGDGPAAAALDPRPSNFHDRERFEQRSVYAIYSTITLGVPGTAMAGFAALSDEERWGLAFRVSGFSTTDAERERGAALWRSGAHRLLFPDLASVTAATAAEVRAGHGEGVVSLLGYLRSEPALVARTEDAPLVRTARRLGESLDAYRRGKVDAAQQLAASAYLDGFELVEPSLDAVDRGLRGTVEVEMGRYRAMIRSGEPVAAVESQAARIQTLLEEAAGRLGGSGLAPGAAFIGAFAILLREGLEAILIVAAIVAMLVKAGRRDALPSIHFGWIAALVLGVLTWVAASYLVSVSGASREMTEGITSLLAVVVLVYVGFWMHDKAHAERWRAFVESRLRGALSGRTRTALVLVSFLAVYREAFEVVLFAEALWAQGGPATRAAVLGGFGAASVALLG